MRPGSAASFVLALASVLTAQAPAEPPDPDRDGDGLSDFRETHKYRTDPGKRDSDGDGLPDGDWLERREYQYTIRTVVHVLRPVTPALLDDDYQDVRVLDATAEHVELEVIHYPFNTVASAIVAEPAWRTKAKAMALWTRPGPTADWTPEFADQLQAALKSAGIDARTLDDKTLVERAAVFLLQRAKYHDGFTSFLTAFDQSGVPYVPDQLQAAAERGKHATNLSLEQQWQREISARGMFANQQRGSCTSTAIYLNGCLRALSVPTRTVLCIPAIDGNDERERALLRGLQHHGVRATLMASLQELRGWASHTFNEVWVGGRWRRLNADRLGQDIYDRNCFGLMTHIATFGDWAEADMPATVGRRQALEQRSALFDTANPYSAIALRDEFGRHCKLDNPEPGPAAAAARGPRQLRIADVVWTDSEQLPAEVLSGLGPKNRFGLIARVPDAPDGALLTDFLERADLRLYLEAKDHPTLSVGLDRGCWWRHDGQGLIYVPFGPADRRDLATGVSYRVRLRNAAADASWQTDPELAIVRKAD